MNSYAYWILPKRINGSSLIEVPTRHIIDVTTYPKKFGETKESIAQEYTKYNEPLGLEGKAREVILKRVLKRGFGRVRFEMRSQKWSIQIWRLSDKYNDRIFEFAMEASTLRNVSKESDVYIHTLGTNKMIKTTLSDILTGRSITENRLKIRKTREMFLNNPDYNDYVDSIDESLLSTNIELIYEDNDDNSK